MPIAQFDEMAWAQWRERYGRRAVGFGAALLLELVLIALLLSLGRVGNGSDGASDSLVSFDVGPPPAEEQVAEVPRERNDGPQELAPRPEPRPDPQPDPAEAPPRSELSLIPLSRDELAGADLSNLPRRRPDRPASPAYGPQFAPSPGDSEVVGQAPNGEPLYAARWYREPNQGELAGYLSTASGPGWALIACRTAPQWRVEDCVGLDEYPQGSNMLRAVLAAAWQFQVRPPRRGNESLVGSWVRIRIEYTRGPPISPRR